MKLKNYAALAVMALTILSVNSAHAKTGNVCITVNNVSENTVSLEAYDTVDEVHWVGLTGGPLRIAPGSTGTGCFKTQYKDQGVDIRVTSVYMGDIVASGGLSASDVAAEGSFSGKTIMTTSAGYTGFIGTLKDGETLLIQ